MFTKLWTIKLSDWQRGLIVAVLTAPLTIIYESVTATPMKLVFDWKTIVGTGIAGGIAYILKNFSTGAGGRLLTDAPPRIGIYEVDFKRGTFIRLSESICKGLGYTPEELIGEPVTKVLTPESAQQFRDRIGRMAGGEVMDGKVEYTAVAKNGVRIPITIDSFYKIEHGKIIGAIVSATEITNG